MTRRWTTCAEPAAPPQQVELVERYTKEQGLFRTDDGPDADLHEDAFARS